MPAWLQAESTPMKVTSSGATPDFFILSKTATASLPWPCMARPSITEVHETMLFCGMRSKSLTAPLMSPHLARAFTWALQSSRVFGTLSLSM
ncbi:unnamed protein product [Spirodela intermedia]|uniref:Uncharacterized protein n=2 Tax=Spirodela intermedia TaxID=51605 RepID=A0A7I8IMX8_SPIIN|nr:unnamed protein product [Spirodela intermedia]CAA6658314.1 unnamed protein product [Spirodela intermedia]CAA7394511.1 unnamed protein product [Spirodela intermedia]